MRTDEVQALREDDVLLAISFSPFHADTVAAAESARARGVSVLALTDSALSPSARHTQVVLEGSRREDRWSARWRCRWPYAMAWP
ncbi:MAG TPA: SIS domain-containing protein [Ramlibacter sp.]|nr:SIS domain-containing protein [Ramlibacter sp.]